MSARKKLDKAGREKLFALLPDLVKTRQKRDAIRKETRAERRARRAAHSGESEENLTAIHYAKELGVTKFYINFHINYVLFHSLEALIEKGEPETDAPLDVPTAVNIIELVVATGLSTMAINAMFGWDLTYSLPDWMDWRMDCEQPFALNASVMDFVPNQDGIVAKYPTWNVKYIDELVRAKMGMSFRDALIEHELRLNLQKHKYGYHRVTSLKDFKLYMNKPDSSLQKVDVLIDCYFQMRKPSNREIANVLGMSLSEVRRMVSFIDLHDEAELRALPDMHYPVPYNDLEISWIIDFMEASNLSAERVAIIFKMPPNKLEAAVSKRKKLGRWYPPFIANVPDNIDLHVLSKLISKNNDGAEFPELVDKYYKQFDLDAKQAARNALEIYLSRAKKNLCQSTAAKKVMADTEALERSLEAGDPFLFKVLRFDNKRIVPLDYVDSSVMDIASDDNGDNASSHNVTTDTDDQTSSSHVDRGSDTYPHPDSFLKTLPLYAKFCESPKDFTRDEFASLMHEKILNDTGFDIGILASDFIATGRDITKGGRLKMINPFSEHFNDLPLSVREVSIKGMQNALQTMWLTQHMIDLYRYELCNPEYTHAQRRNAAVKLYKMIIEQMPRNFMKAIVQRQLGLKSNHTYIMHGEKKKS